MLYQAQPPKVAILTADVVLANAKTRIKTVIDPRNSIGIVQSGGISRVSYLPSANGFMSLSHVVVCGEVLAEYDERCYSTQAVQVCCGWDFAWFGRLPKILDKRWQ